MSIGRVDTIVAGAEVVGLTIARALSLAGREVLVIDSEATIGSGISSRNSEVIHAGLYYPPGSLKAQLCVAGREIALCVCTQRGITHKRVGKLIVATQAGQEVKLDSIMTNALACEVRDISRIDANEARALRTATPMRRRACLSIDWHNRQSRAHALIAGRRPVMRSPIRVQNDN